MRSILRGSLDSTLLTIVMLRLPRKRDVKRLNGLTDIFEIRLSEHFTSAHHTSLPPRPPLQFITNDHLLS